MYFLLKTLLIGYLDLQNQRIVEQLEQLAGECFKPRATRRGEL